MSKLDDGGWIDEAADEDTITAYLAKCKKGDMRISYWFDYRNREKLIVCVSYYHDAWNVGLTHSYREWIFDYQ